MAAAVPAAVASMLSHARIYRLDESAGELHRVACGGRHGGSQSVISLHEPTLLAWAIRQREAVYIPRVDKDPRCQRFGAEEQCVYAVPLQTGARVLGILEVAADHPDGIRSVTRKLIDQVATQAALALERSELHKQLRVSTGERKKAEQERNQLQQQLFQAQKMEALGTLAGGIAHDFNNLLSVMLGFASLARQRLSTDDPLQDSMGMIEQSAQRAAELTRQLLCFARPERQRVKPVCVNDVTDRVRRMVERTFDRNITVAVLVGSEALWVNAEPSYLEQALLNICINARDAMPQGGTLTLEVGAVALEEKQPELPATCAPGRYARISVQDSGAGIAPETLSRVFEPFFTTKEPGRGTGLGLAMVYGFVKSHDGFVKVDSEPGHGARFTMSLPLIPAPVPQTGAGGLGRIQPGRGTVLVADDESLVRAFATEALKGLGYRVLVAENGKQALQIYEQQRQEIDCVLLDLIMPELSGLEAYRRMRAVDPEVRVVFASGYSTGEILRDAPDARSAAFIGKPYTLEGLSIALRKAGMGQPRCG